MTKTIAERLAAPFPPELVTWRVGSTTQDKKKGMALAFIDARDVMNRLDEVVGPENWQNRYTHAEAKTVCEIDVWFEGRGWVTKSDGAGDTDVEAEKGSLSSAFKRAAVRWGVGRYLYDLPSPWVELEPAGRSYKISAAGQAMLKRVVAGEKVSTETPEQEDPEKHAVVIAAKAAIDLCRDQKDMDNWAADNGQMVQGLSDDLARAIRRHFGQHQEKLRKAA